PLLIRILQFLAPLSAFDLFLRFLDAELRDLLLNHFSPLVIAIVIVSYPRITLDPIAWMMSLDTLAGMMILLGGLLLLFRK
ncbi:MAG: hypothetical protein ACFE7R_09120, partial [Candidatus Hodarchaeota archaeon]